MPDSPSSLDGLSPAPEKTVTPKTDEPMLVRRWEFVLLAVLGGFYILYILWAFLLMSILPSGDGSLDWLVPIGVGSALLATILLFGVGGLLFTRIAQSRAQVTLKKWSLIKLGSATVPGLLISGLLAVLIIRQPALTIDIVSPASSADYVAPLVMSFSLDTSMKVLSKRGFHPIQYKWDINGDGKVDRQSVDPTLSATYTKEGLYTVTVSMIAADSTVQIAAKRFLIARSVFTVTPVPPIVEKPVVFSIANLVSDPTTISQVLWDFNGDGKTDITTKDPEVTNIFYKTGDYKVAATVALQNNTQATYSRTITIVDAPKLPFPVTMQSQPTNLIGSPPFAVLFSTDTKEPIAQVEWTFGDDGKGEGTTVAHTYTANGNYPVEAQVRSESGITAVLDTVVQVVDPLDLPDLTFTGTPTVQGTTIEGEVPLTLNLTPHTNTAFVTFNWEAPDADEVGSTAGTLQAIYRRPGTYTLTLVGQDLNNHVLRKPFTLKVDQPAAFVTFGMNPESGVTPLNVSFDASATSIPNDDVTGFIWDFGDGTPPVTQGASVSHQYTQPRTYTVGLTVQAVSGKSYQTSRVLVVRAASLQACFTRSRDTIHPGDAVQFDAGCTTGTPAHYLWDFGDASQNDQASPVHTFTQAGNFTVVLTVDDAQGNKSSYSSIISVQ